MLPQQPNLNIIERKFKCQILKPDPIILAQVSDRFPDLDSLVTAKLLLPHEAARLQRVDHRTPHEATWTPILWALKLVCKAR